MSMLSRRACELAGLMAIGDGTMALLKPQEHAALWRGGPEWWDRTVQYFEERPTLTRTLGAAGVLFGIWLAARQEEAGAEKA
ncbi:MAG TPA: hypothetical protein VFG41_03230 [Sphingomicrobium sp.]|jgi:hypothetical protein|nr:hypothetical protein [Sphingomicrobium sp.]